VDVRNAHKTEVMHKLRTARGVKGGSSMASYRRVRTLSRIGRSLALPGDYVTQYSDGTL
jgi:hypothetical protein